MHIVLVNRFYPPHSGYGGIAIYNYNLARALTRLGHKVSVVSSHWETRIPAQSEEEGVFVHRILIKDTSRFCQLPRIGKYIKAVLKFFYSVRVAKKLKEMEKETKIDLIEFAEAEGEGFVYLMSKRKCTVVVRCHTPMFILPQYYLNNRHSQRTKFIEAMEKYSIQHADLLTAPSRDMANVIAEECRIAADRIVVIPNGLGWEMFVRAPKSDFDRNQNNEITVLHVGRLDAEKGIEVLGQAIILALKQMPKLKFVFIGDSGLEAEVLWKKRFEEILSADELRQVKMLGKVDQVELAAWYQRADIAVVPSLIYESFSYTCAQAMAAGVPVIASRIGGIPETVDHGINGLLVEAGNVEKLAEAILKLARDSDLRKKFGLEGRKKAEKKFDASVTAKQFIECIEKYKKHHERCR